MVRLEGTPAFGLETNNWNADKFYKKELCGTDEAINIKAREAFDQAPKAENSRTLENFKSIAQSDAKVRAHFFRDWMNKNKILGYIPIIGTVIGILRIKDAAVDENNLHHDRVKHIVRGTVEALSLGFLWAIPDLIISMRHRKDQPEVSSEEVGDSSSYSTREASESEPESPESSEYSSIEK